MIKMPTKPVRMAIAAAILAAAALETKAMTCSDGIAFVTKFSVCPELCKDDPTESLEDGERYCKEGESPRSPSVCGASAAPACGPALTEMSKVDFDKVIAALASCTGEFAPYAAYAQYGADYAAHAIRDIASKCGYDESILDPSIFPAKGSCAHSIGLLAVFDRCPEACEDDTDEPLEAGERYCKAGESPRSPSVCGATVAPECGLALTEMSKADLDMMVKGLASCTGQFAQYAAYAQYGADYIRMAIRDIARTCGYDESILDPSARPTEGSCAHSIGLISKFDSCPEVCEDDTDEPLDAGERYCKAGESPRSPSVCGATAAPECGRVLTEMSKLDAEELIAGLASCTGAFAPYAAYAQYGAEFLGHSVRDIARKCGYDESILDPSIFPKEGSCAHSIQLLATFERCPEACKSDFDSSLTQRWPTCRSHENHV